MSVFIKKLHIISFGQFSDTSIEFSKNINLIYGKNESGKSTIVSFIEALLYGFDDGKKIRHFNQKHEIYRPISSYKYSGYGIFSKDGVDYRISRDFSDGSYEIYDLNSKEIVASKNSNLAFPGEFLLGISYDIYKDLTSIYQSQESNSQTKEKIIEMLINKDDYVFSSSNALEILDKSLADIGTDRAYSKPYARTKKQISFLENEISKLKILRNSYIEEFKNLEKNREEIARISDDLNNFKDLRDSFRKNLRNNNLKDQLKYENQLKMVDKKLEKYKNYDDYYAHRNENLTFNKNNYFIGLALLIISAIFAFYKNNIFIFALGLVLATLFCLFQWLKFNNLSKINNKEYNANESKYLEFIKIKNEKEKIEEILSILENQEKSENLENYTSKQDINIREVEDKINIYENELESLIKTNIDLEKNLAKSEDELSKLPNLTKQLESLKEKLNDMENEIQAINLAKDKIIEIIESAKDFLDDYDKKVSDMVNILTRGRYEKIIYDKDLKTKVYTNSGEILDLDKLSTGFYDQLNFAFKYSINEKNSDDFLIFDDAFINYDMDRLRNALYFLLDMTRSRQIIYFTCHKREMEILDSEAIAYNKIYLEEI